MKFRLHRRGVIWEASSNRLKQSGATNPKDTLDTTHRRALLIGTQDGLPLLGAVLLVLRRLAAVAPTTPALVHLFAVDRMTVAHHLPAPAMTTQNGDQYHTPSSIHPTTLRHELNGGGLGIEFYSGSE